MDTPDGEKRDTVRVDLDDTEKPTGSYIARR